MLLVTEACNCWDLLRRRSGSGGRQGRCVAKGYGRQMVWEDMCCDDRVNDMRGYWIKSGSW